MEAYRKHWGLTLVKEKTARHFMHKFYTTFWRYKGESVLAKAFERQLRKAFPPILFKITVKGVEEMNYRIETKDAFRIVGVSVPLHKDIEKNFTVIPPKWQEISMNGTLQRLISMMDTPPMGVLGVSTCNDTEPWKYYIAVSTSQEKNELEEYIVPAATWAIFSGEGTNQSIQELERRIVTEWLPTSGYEYGNAPDVEVYLNPDPQNAQYEVWIPVVKK